LNLELQDNVLSTLSEIGRHCPLESNTHYLVESVFSMHPIAFKPSVRQSKVVLTAA